MDIQQSTLILILVLIALSGISAVIVFAAVLYWLYRCEIEKRDLHRELLSAHEKLQKAISSQTHIEFERYAAHFEQREALKKLVDTEEQLKQRDIEIAVLRGKDTIDGE